MHHEKVNFAIWTNQVSLFCVQVSDFSVRILCRVHILGQFGLVQHIGCLVDLSDFRVLSYGPASGFRLETEPIRAKSDGF